MGTRVPAVIGTGYHHNSIIAKKRGEDKE